MEANLHDEFRIAIPDTDLDDLARRLDATRWPRRVESGWSEGTEPSLQRSLLDTWRHDFDWRAQEASLNEMPQFVIAVDVSSCTPCTVEARPIPVAVDPVARVAEHVR
jgi:hypothetical protein